MNLQALQDCLIVEPEMEKHALFALLRQKQTGFGIVLAAGPDAKEIKVGDKVLFGKYSGNDIKIDGEEHLIMREEDILAVIK